MNPIVRVWVRNSGATSDGFRGLDSGFNQNGKMSVKIRDCAMITKMFTGRCSVCGRMLEVENLELTMTLREGKYSFKREKFHALLCAVCQDKIFRRKSNSWVAAVCGVVFAFVTFLWTPHGMWLVQGHCDWAFVGLVWLVIASFGLWGRTDGRPLASDRNYQCLSGAGYRLGNRLWSRFLLQLVLIFSMTSTLVWAGAFWMRAQQDGWTESMANITQEDSRVVPQMSKGGRVTGYRTCSKFQYAYDAGGTSHIGTDYGHRLVSGNVPGKSSWTKGAKVKVFFDPRHPERSVAGKVDPQPFQWCMLAAWLLAAVIGAVVVLCGFFADLPYRDQATGAPYVDPLLAEGEPSNVLPLMLMVALFAVGFVLVCAWPGLRVEDPIFGRYVSFYGFAMALVVGVMCSMTGIAMHPHRPLKSHACVCWLGAGVLSVALVFHFLCAFGRWGHGMYIPACVVGFFFRCCIFSALGIASFVVSATVAVLALRFLPSLRATLVARGLAAEDCLMNTARLIAWAAALGLLAYEICIAWSFKCRGWFQGG